MKRNLCMIWLILTLCLAFGTLAGAQDAVQTARPSVNGALHVSGTVLADESGQEVVLRGLSTHGLTWFPDFVDEGFFRQLSDSWDLSLVRLAMYSDIYCSSKKNQQLSLDLIEKGIDAAIASDMYVIADWHVLRDNNPLEHKEEAALFFRTISEKYAGSPNILYEICNEPNGSATWADIRAYAQEIIPIIRENDPDSVILVGTPDFDRDLMVAALDPLPFDQVMYSCHFYASSHKDALQAELLAVLEKGLPVFITECGLSESEGSGAVDYDSAKLWFSILKENKLSYTVWSMSNKAESSALFRTIYEPNDRITDKSLSSTGLWVRELIRGEDPLSIPIPKDSSQKSLLEKAEDFLSTSGKIGLKAAGSWPLMAVFGLAAVVILWITGSLYIRNRVKRNRVDSYDTLDALRPVDPSGRKNTAFPVYHSQKTLRRIGRSRSLVQIIILISIFFSLLYLIWRIRYSMPVRYGALALILNIILLVVEIMGFLETLVHFQNMLHMKDHPLPIIGEDEYPDVDIFIATYNEPESLLRKTINGCIHLKYPDPDKVHIWICDDNRRPGMRKLAEQMGVGYFDRPDNKGAKAGNLNHAMGLTSAPYIVTLDADMIPKSDFLLKTIPYFVDVEKRCSDLPPEKRTSLGLLQTPQCFYNPDVFQHALYSERRSPNEQDFFYRSIEVAKTATNSVIYGGSNTVLSRRALEAVGGFYTGSITEDFATGLLIESAGFISLAIPEPLASGVTPYSFKDHVKQRTRWGRGVIVTARKLKLWRRKGLTLLQRINYWSSVFYWYSPIKNLVYMLAPLMFAAFAIPIFRCSWLELVMYWLPMFLMQEFSLRLVSGNRVSTKWSGIYETSVMWHMLIPIVKEALGITLSTFKVTDKSGSAARRKRDWRSMLPFLILIGLSVAGIIRVFLQIRVLWSFGLLILLFFIIRNLYFLMMAVFLVDGRDEDAEPVHVYDAEPLVIRKDQEEQLQEGITTHLTEHSFSFFLDEEDVLQIGDRLTAVIHAENARADLTGVIISQLRSASSGRSVYTMEILDFNTPEEEYLQILYDRVPTLPQNLNRDYDIFRHLWVNIANRLRKVK